MAIMGRKKQAIGRMWKFKNKEIEKEKWSQKKESTEEVNEKEHKKRMEKLKEIGLVKEKDEMERDKEELIGILKRYYLENGKFPSAVKFQNDKDYPGPSKFVRCFGSWNTAIKEAERSLSKE